MYCMMRWREGKGKGRNNDAEHMRQDGPRAIQADPGATSFFALSDLSPFDNC
jgi:hypothetical protein